MDTLVHLMNVNVVQSRTKLLSDADKKDEIDSFVIQGYLNSDLSYLLSKTSLATISNYGSYGALSSVRLRGGGAANTTVLWNGLPINSLTTGGADFSMINVGAFDEINVVYGASGSIYGSSTFGGAIELNNNPVYIKSSELSVSYDAGSFSNHRLRGGGKFSNSNFSYSGQVFASKGVNDFKFIDKELTKDGVIEVEEIMSNAETTDFGTIHSLFYKFNRHSFNAGVWYQSKDHNIPGKMGQGIPLSNQNQKDSTLKTVIGWNCICSNTQFNVLTGYITDGLKYFDGDPESEPSKIATRRWINQVGGRFYLNNLLILSAMMKYNRLIGDVYAYGKMIVEEEQAISLAAKYQKKWLIVNSSVEKEFNSITNPPLMFALSGLADLIPQRVTLRAKISSHYRRPTFNERYWQSGGNLLLNSESGTGWETGAIFQNATQLGFFTIDINYYFSNNDNQIQWVPFNGLSKAVNTGKVLSKGIETKIKWNYDCNTYGFIVQLAYAYGQAQYNDPSEKRYKEYLSYQPRHLVRFNASARINDLLVGLNTSFQSLMYDNDNIKMKEVFLTDANCLYNIDIENIDFGITMRVENLFNYSYQLVYAYPMPGRTYWIGLTFKI